MTEVGWKSWVQSASGRRPFNLWKLGYPRKKRRKQRFCRLWHSTSQSNRRFLRPCWDQPKALSEISMTPIFFIDQALSCAGSHFQILSSHFSDFSAAGNVAFIWRLVHLESHKNDPGRQRHRGKAELIGKDETNLFLKKKNQNQNQNQKSKIETFRMFM